jgi:hypothetical protein
MKNKLIKLLFSLSSFSGVIMFLLINNNLNIPFVRVKDLTEKIIPTELVMLFKYLLVTLCVVLFAKLVLYIGKKAFKTEGNITDIIKVKPMEGQFLPVYIGLFVIALSFNGELTISSIFLIVILFILWVSFETVSYFNPFFIILGYRFYEIETIDNITSIIITKRKDVKQIAQFTNLTRLNNFTFLEYSYDK